MEVRLPITEPVVSLVLFKQTEDIMFSCYCLVILANVLHFATWSPIGLPFDASCSKILVIVLVVLVLNDSGDHLKIC